MGLRAKTTQRGFTFIEVLVALAVASIGLLSLLKLHLVSMATADAAEAQTAAVFLAQEKLAEVAATDYPGPGAESGFVERNGLRLAWQTEITDARPADLSLRGVRRIRSTVTWQRGSDRKSLHMTTLVADTKIDERKSQ